MKRFLLFVTIGLIGCDAAHRDRDEDELSPDAGMHDPLTCGTATCDQVPAPSCVDDETLREYAASCDSGACSYPSTDLDCGSAGCCGDHCCELAASNADVFGSPLPTGLVVAPPNGTFDTSTECTQTSALGSCTVVTRDDLPDACVCRMDELTIGTLDVKGDRALVLLAYKTVRVETLLDVSGDLGKSGPGGIAVYAGPPATSTSGGHGGSYATEGGQAYGRFGSAAPAYGSETLVPLVGGMRGQWAGDDGGGGGGALQITAGVSIEVLGKINAGGGGGEGGFSTWGYSGGGGGGSGGAILLEAPDIVMTGSLIANGGGGGGGGGTGGGGGYGEDGQDNYPSGGAGHDGAGCPLYGYVSGGDGGTGATQQYVAGSGGSSDYDSSCIGSDSFVGGGGGGGGLGRIRINTVTGCQCSGEVSPNATFGTLGVQ